MSKRSRGRRSPRRTLRDVLAGDPADKRGRSTSRQPACGPLRAVGRTGESIRSDQPCGVTVAVLHSPIAGALLVTQAYRILDVPADARIGEEPGARMFAVELMRSARRILIAEETVDGPA